MKSEAKWECSSVPASQQVLGYKDIFKIMKNLDPKIRLCSPGLCLVVHLEISLCHTAAWFSLALNGFDLPGLRYPNTLSDKCLGAHMKGFCQPEC